MKLIFINRFFHPDHSATSQMLTDLAFFMAECGHDVQVITSRLLYDNPSTVLPTGEKIKGVSIHRVWTSRFGRNFLPGRALDYLTFYSSTAWRLLQLVKKGDLVIAKTDPPMISVLASWISHWRGATLVNWLQDLFPEVAIKLGVRGFSGFFGKWLSDISDLSLQRAGMNIVIGERMKASLLNKDIPCNRVKVIHNWADGAVIRPLEQDHNPLRKEWHLENKFIVAHSGNLGRAHEYQTVLEAARRLIEDQEILFLFIGAGAQLSRLKVEAEEPGLSNIIFKPYQAGDKLCYSLTLPDLHLTILRPEMEGLIVPSKIYGILASGTASLFVGDRNGEVAHILREAKAGTTVRTGDVQSLVEKIIEFRDNPENRLQMGVNARRVFNERFSREHALEKWSSAIP